MPDELDKLRFMNPAAYKTILSLADLLIRNRVTSCSMRIIHTRIDDQMFLTTTISETDPSELSKGLEDRS